MNTVKAGTSNCEMCGEIKELRPYGPGGSFVCFSCAMKDPEGTEQRFAEILGEGALIDARNPDGDPGVVLEMQSLKEPRP